MSVIYILIVICIIAAIGFLIVFIWAVRSGQYDDVETPAIRILFEDMKLENNTENSE